MGWIFYDSIHLKPNGSVDRKKEMDSGFDNGHMVVKSAMVGSVYYAAIKKESTNDVYGFVALTSSDKKGSGFNFGYKDMDETCGPYEYKCPLSILNILTETDNEYAQGWRAKCRKYHEDRKSPNHFRSLPFRAKVIWTVPHGNFSGYRKGDRVELIKSKSRGEHAYWYSLGDRWRINPKYVDMDDYEIVPAQS